jgi:thiosulfate reductase/polysulfide reductase chain A
MWERYFRCCRKVKGERAKDLGEQMSGVSRRTLLKGGVAGLSTVVLGPDFFWQCLGSEAAQGRNYVSLFTGRVTRGTPTTCGVCPAGCGLLAFVDEGRLIGLAGNPEHPYNQGALCVFGSAALQLIDGPCRIRKPLRRLGKRGEDCWEEISWEEALGIVTKALSGKKVKAEPMTDDLVICVPGHEATPLVDRFLAFHPKGLLALADGHEHPVETAAHESFSPGFDGQADLAKADRILNFGANPLGSIRRLVGSARQWAEGQEKGVTWITLDPRLSETAAASHTWIPLRPGTDGVFALALAHQILKNGWEDRAFLESGTDVDRETLWELLAPWTPEKAATFCQVPEERIRWTAETFARADRPVAIFGSGVTARSGGLEDAQAVLLLNFLVGNIGREGGYRLPGRIEWQQPAPMPAVDREAPVLRGTLFWELQRGNRKIGCLLSHDANPAVTDPDPGETVKALKDESRVPFHVALASGWNETVRLADLVLPASTFLESWGLLQPGTEAGPAPCVNLRQPVCGPRKDTRSLDELLLEIAGSLGGDWKKAFPFRDVEDYYRILLRRSLSVDGPAGGFKEAKKQGFLAVTGTAGNAGEKVRMMAVLSRSVPRITEGIGERERKKMDSGRKTLILYASPTRGGLDHSTDWVDEIDHADPAMIHPKAAEGLGLRDGDWVMLTGPAGSVKTRVRLTEGIHPEAVAMAAATLDRESTAPCPDETAPEGNPGGQRRWWEDESYGGNARQIIPWPEDPHVQAPGWMDTAVTVRKL